MTSAQPDSLVRVPLLRQAWRTVSFVHWRYPASSLQSLLPSDLVADEYDGSGWLTLTPLQMNDVRLPGTPPVPRLSTFAETNLRTYVRGPGGGEPGLWFFSLDAARVWITIGARLALGAPYFRALAIEDDDGIRYSGTRKGRTRAAYRLHVRPGPKIDADPLDLFLTYRWRAYTRYAGQLLEIPVRHEPWPLQTAAVTTLDESLTTAAALPPPGDIALAHYSADVAGVAFGVPRLARRG